MTLLSRKHHQNSNSGAATGHVAAETHPQAEHSHTEDYVSAGAHAAVSQIFRELTDKQNMAILSGIFYVWTASFTLMIDVQAVTQSHLQACKILSAVVADNHVSLTSQSVFRDVPRLLAPVQD